MRILKVTLGLAVGVLVLAAVAFAAWPAVAQAQSATPGAPGFGHDGEFGFGPHDGKALISATASVTGLTPQEVKTELQSGKSLAQIAESKGKTADDVIQAARTQLADRLKQEVTDGRITQAQADTKLADFDQNASQIVNDTGLGQGPDRGFGHGGGKPGFGHGGSSFIEATASVTGLTAQEVMTERQSGKSLAQIAESKGKTADDVIQAARTQLADRLKQEVTDGRMTQAQADAKLAGFDQNASQIVNDTALGQGPDRGFGHGGGKPGFGPDGGSFISATASVTGLTPQEVMTERQSGKSLAQIAESKGKTADDVIQAARTQLADQLKQAVSDGRITQAQADTKLSDFDQNASQIVNDTTPIQRPGGGRHNNPATPTPTNTAGDSA